MDKEQKKEFINSLVEAVRTDILNNVERMPDNWDGHELRLYIREKYSEVYWKTMTRSRVREYNNTVLVNNL